MTAKASMGLVAALALAALAKSLPMAAELPTDFDSRSLVFGCADTVMDQAHCGSCWAFSVTGALTDRYCIWSGGRLFSHTMSDDSATLSPQPLLSCGEGDGACDGGSEGHAWNYYVANGSLTCRRQQTQYGVTCDTGCAPYLSANCGEGGDPKHDGCSNCQRDVCNDGGDTPVEWDPELWANSTEDSGAPHMVFHAAEYAQVGASHDSEMLPDVEAIQTEIMTNGPVSTCFRFHENFHSFFDEQPLGVYNTTNNSKQVGGHCVKIVGWGTDVPSGLEYWLVANSWTTNWGTHGFFRFKRGDNLCEMDNSTFAGCPPADVSAGTDRAPGSQCKLTTPTARPPSAAIWGGEWIEHDVDTALLESEFIRNTLAAMALDSHGKVRAVAAAASSLAPLAHATERTRLLLAPEATSQVTRARTQVTRGMHVEVEMDFGDARIAVFALHDALDFTVRVTKAHVLK